VLLAHVADRATHDHLIAVQPGYAVGQVEHVRLVDPKLGLVALLDGHVRPVDLEARALLDHVHLLERHAHLALEREEAPGLTLQLEQLDPAGAGQLGRHFRVQADPERLRRGAVSQLSELALGLHRHRVLRQHPALAAARRADRGERLADALGRVLAGHLDQAQR
jgi:hypothetical protein